MMDTIAYLKAQAIAQRNASNTSSCIPQNIHSYDSLYVNPSYTHHHHDHPQSSHHMGHVQVGKHLVLEVDKSMLVIKEIFFVFLVNTETELQNP